MHFFNFTFFLVLIVSTCKGQTAKMDFVEYEPVSTLIVPEHKLSKAKFPFIDVHNHQFSMATMDLTTLTKEMDKLNMKVMVNLSGQSGDFIINSVKNIQRSATFHVHELPFPIYRFRQC